MSSKNNVREPFELGRNEPCFCGSTLRFKKCCGNTEPQRKPPHGILVVENHLSETQCREILDIVTSQPSKPIEAFDASTSTAEKVETTFSDQRITHTVDMSAHQTILNTLVEDAIRNVIEPRLETTIEWFEQPQLLQYHPGGFYDAHADSDQFYPDKGVFMKVMDRDISLLLYLDEDFEGGEVEFPNFDFKVKPRRGMLIFFPSDSRYLHTALPVTAGIRHCVVSWMSARGVEKIRPANPKAVML